MKLQPANDRILVRREEPKSEGLIQIAAQEKPTTGRVLAVGPGRTLDNGLVQPCGVKDGDLILFSKHSGLEVYLAGEPFVILRADDILGVLS